MLVLKTYQLLFILFNSANLKYIFFGLNQSNLYDKFRYMKNKVISALPFFIISIITLYTCFEIITTDYIATIKHYITFILIAINGIIYFVRYKFSVILTGIILVLATFNLLSFYTVTQTSSVGVNLGSTQLKTPEIQLWSLLILVFYCIINFNLLIEWYVDIKEKRK